MSRQPSLLELGALPRARGLLRAAGARGDLRPDLDIGRARAGLAGSLIYTRLLVDRDIDDAFVEAVIDDFIATNAPD